MSERQCRRCLRAGNCIRVLGVDERHPSARRLLSMGVDAGCELRVERQSPFGDPYIVKVKGYELAVRRRDFEALDVEELKGSEV